jgi:hypothetical protein
MFIVYSSTYLTANLTERICQDSGMTANIHQCRIVTAITTSIVNMIAINWKDMIFAGLSNQRHSNNYNHHHHRLIRPLLSHIPIAYSLFALRDSITIFSAFLFKYQFADYLIYNSNSNNNNQSYPLIQWSFPWQWTQQSAELFSSFLLPITAQLISTPFHILGMDIYNTNISGFTTHTTHIHNIWQRRWQQIMKNYSHVCLSRILRIIPAFCIGSFVNDSLKQYEAIWFPAIYTMHPQTLQPRTILTTTTSSSSTLLFNNDSCSSSSQQQIEDEEFLYRSQPHILASSCIK